MHSGIRTLSTITFFLFSGLCSAESLTVYSCENGSLIQQEFSTQKSTSDSVATLLRSGQAVWSSGTIDKYTIDAMAEGRGIWFAAPLPTLMQVAGTQVAPEILTAIALKETGRKERFWPWSINWAGKSYYLESREHAIEAAKQLIKAGYTNFDTSVMQVNWRWHGHRFANIDAAFDPVTNIRVAEQILVEQFNATGSWRDAIARYHSKTPSRNQPYLADVLQKMGELQKKNLETPEKKIC